MLRIDTEFVEASASANMVSVETPQRNSVQEMMSKDCSPFPLNTVHKQFSVTSWRL